MLRAVVPNDGTITVRYAPIKDCEEFIIFKELVELADQNDFRVGSSCWKVSDQKILFGFKAIRKVEFRKLDSFIDQKKCLIQ